MFWETLCVTYLHTWHSSAYMIFDFIFLQGAPGPDGPSGEKGETVSFSQLPWQGAKTADWLEDNDVNWPVSRNGACAKPEKLKIERKQRLRERDAIKSTRLLFRRRRKIDQILEETLDDNIFTLRLLNANCLYLEYNANRVFIKL